MERGSQNPESFKFTRERFRDTFNICFIFLLRSFSLKYFIHRAPDFFDWRSSIIEFPTKPDLLKQESSRLLEEGDYKKYQSLTAEEKLKKNLEIQELLEEKHQTTDNKAELLNENGLLLIAAQEYEAALRAFDKAIEFKPDKHEAWYNRGYALRQLGRLEQAIASYDKAIEFKPDFHEAWYSRGNALDDLGRLEQAIASYDKAIEINPSYLNEILKQSINSLLKRTGLSKLYQIYTNFLKLIGFKR